MLVRYCPAGCGLAAGGVAPPLFPPVGAGVELAWLLELALELVALPLWLKTDELEAMELLELLELSLTLDDSEKLWPVKSRAHLESLITSWRLPW